ncbi:MAG TPA: hypothetical protein VM260_17585, partial [Pirellula sp.]|nr:hypothetical protein [Pirellula sp.]
KQNHRFFFLLEFSQQYFLQKSTFETTVQWRFVDSAFGHMVQEWLPIPINTTGDPYAENW